MSPRARAIPRHTPLTEAMLAGVAARFRLLGEPARLRLLQVLRRGPSSVTALAEETGLSHANASKHLLVLTAGGFLSRREEGPRAVYALADDTTEALCAILCDRVARRGEAVVRSRGRR